MYIVPAGPAGYYHIKPVHTYSPPSQKCLDVAAFCFIDLAIAAGIKGQFIAQDVFQPAPAVWSPGNPSPLVANWQAIVDAWVTAMGPRINHVSSIFIADEPFIDLYNRGWSSVQIRDAMQNVILRFRTTGGATMHAAAWQNVPMMFNEYPGRFNVMLVPSAMNWVAFDCYDGPSGWGSAWTSCGDTGQSIPTHLATLKTKLIAGQRVVLTPLASNNGGAPSPSRVDELLWLADRYVELAVSDPVVVGFQPWYARIPSMGTGVLDIPELRDKWRFLGRGLGFGTP
jgi:hypothetical protein